MDRTGRFYVGTSEKENCSKSKTFREKKVYRKRAILEKPHQPCIQLAFAISYETLMQSGPLIS